MSSSTPNEDRVIQLGRVRLRPALRELIRTDGASEIIEPRVMRFLSVLADHCGQIVARDRLALLCWDGLNVSEDAINRVASRARQVARDAGDGSFRIETISKVGYRLVDLAADDPASPSNSAAPAEPSVRPAPGRDLRWRRAALSIAAMLLVSVLGATIWWMRSFSAPASADTLPKNPAAAALLIQARDDWASRTSAGLARSVEEFQGVTRLEPSYAPAFADLADSYLLDREDGALGDNVAFQKAQRAAQQALRLDPRLAAAHRALGFIQYWHLHDAIAAAASFREAIRLDPYAAQTHFWFANILADNGREDVANAEFQSARLADPGSDQIGADYAWALWIAGYDDAALARLRAIVGRDSSNAEAQDCLASVLLDRGDIIGYLNAERAVAQLRYAPHLLTRVTMLDRAYRQGGRRGLLRARLGAALADQRGATHPDHAEAAYLASLGRDRRVLTGILSTALMHRERWDSAGYVRRIRSRWPEDRRISIALAELVGPQISS